MLEPDRTGVHSTGGKSKAVAIAIFVLVVLAAGLGTAVFLFQDKIFV
jgi:hypothetical protein